MSVSGHPRLGRIARNTVVQIAILLSLILFIANVNALVDALLHPEIGYFDLSHIVVGGVSSFGCAVLAFLLTAYLRHLNKALATIKKLEAFLPICSHCKKIRKPGGDPRNQESWQSIESYVEERTDSHFSHGICPECRTKYYAQPRPEHGAGASAEAPPSDGATPSDGSGSAPKPAS